MKQNNFEEFLKNSLTVIQFGNLPAKLDLSPHAWTKILNGKKELTARQLDTLSTLSGKPLNVVFKEYDRATKQTLNLQKF
jgi:hypothetical protein